MPITTKSDLDALDDAYLRGWNAALQAVRERIWKIPRYPTNIIYFLIRRDEVEAVTRNLEMEAD